MSDINNKMSSFVVVKQEVIEDEPHTNNEEAYILPDREISNIEIKQEDMELADGEGMNKETDDKLQPSGSTTSTQTLVDEGERAHVCNICDKLFSRNRGLKIHIKTVHEGERAHDCKFCDKSFGGSGTLNRHTKTVHEADDKLQPSCSTTLTRTLVDEGERAQTCKFHFK